MSDDEEYEKSSSESYDSTGETNNNTVNKFSFSKSAIADLPSTQVQSLHIESQGLTEYDDERFVWKDFKTPKVATTRNSPTHDEPLFDPRTSKLSESITKLKNRRLLNKSKQKLTGEPGTRVDSKTKITVAARRGPSQAKSMTKEQQQQQQQPQPQQQPRVQQRTSATKITQRRNVQQSKEKLNRSRNRLN